MPHFTRRRDGMTVSGAEAKPHGVLLDGYSEVLAPGESVVFSALLMDSSTDQRVALTDAAMLYDAAGKPATLRDARTGQDVNLNADLIAAIQAEATRLGLSVKAYLNEVVGFVTHSNALTLRTNA